MKTLSLWALLNPIKSRAIIAVCYLLLAVSGAYLGVLLFARDLLLTRTVFNIGLGLYLAGIACYPMRRARRPFWKKTFLKQKSMDVLLILGYAVMVVSVSNFDAQSAWNEPAASPQPRPIVFNSPATATDGAVAKKMSWDKMGLRKKYKNWVAEVKTARAHTPETAGEIAGVVLLMLLLFGLLGVLTCSLSCSDMGVLAVVVFLGGTVLIIVLGSRWIRHIKERAAAKNAGKPKTE